MPLPPLARSTPMDLRELPGGVSNVTHGEGTTRGVGFAVGFKNIAFAEGFDDYSTARVRLVPTAGRPRRRGADGGGRGGAGARDRASSRSPAPSSTWSASSCCPPTRRWARPAPPRRRARRGSPAGRCSSRAGASWSAWPGAPLGDEPIEETAVYRHRPTQPLDPETGQGDSVVALGFAAHRAVCDVNVELGLVRAVEVATTQDVGRIMNPLALEGQIQGGIAQGVGLALMEEIQLRDGRVRNASFTDYLMPTVLDMPAVRMSISETPHPHAPYGLNGVGEMPTIASTPAVVAAVRDATGRELPRVPLRPSDIAGVG